MTIHPASPPHSLSRPRLSGTGGVAGDGSLLPCVSLPARSEHRRALLRLRDLPGQPRPRFFVTETRGVGAGWRARPAGAPAANHRRVLPPAPELPGQRRRPAMNPPSPLMEAARAGGRSWPHRSPTTRITPRRRPSPSSPPAPGLAGPRRRSWRWAGPLPPHSTPRPRLSGPGSGWEVLVAVVAARRLTTPELRRAPPPAPEMPGCGRDPDDDPALSHQRSFSRPRFSGTQSRGCACGGGWEVRACGGGCSPGGHRRPSPSPPSGSGAAGIAKKWHRPTLPGSDKSRPLRWAPCPSCSPQSGLDRARSVPGASDGRLCLVPRIDRRTRRRGR